MSFTLNPAPFESNVSFNSQKVKSTSELQKRIKKKRKPVQITKFDTIRDNEDDTLENFEPLSRPEITYDVNREKHNDTNMPMASISIDKGEISSFVNNPYLISDELNSINKETKPTIQYENNINEVERKLNYLIKMMEQQKDTNVQYLTEEIVLYGFFGVFIIYVVDSFTRVGKYVR